MSLLTWTLSGVVVALGASGAAHAGSADLASTIGLGFIGALALQRVRGTVQKNRIVDPLQIQTSDRGDDK